MLKIEIFQQKSNNISSSLASALDMVPEMTEKKRRIDLHTNIATHLLTEVKNRQLDKYFELGSAMLLNKHLSHQVPFKYNKIKIKIILNQI